ncbi:hypothetical protein A2697_04750 [Candidatus Curtissbacteria bacterium RIFCSPHIGHO2_01_FULL_41_44]|uniref:NIF system FeS cluster assembly NifU N-terminal domain-containing protein n=1 Tax=Candidatus Curtissbacteria bacterium RIFCSPLOWO2_01_FULL_42_50 TaxID=1797730 RepID=A0A1F5H6G8_9BACT|nr:MAG: hypothetical protein A3C33_03935 [Candidatus Curtissbacteria bacterium RIFCSPHIGHO2_02_FULL_42_58]OGD94330.1 MAG: hypothetical protein A2697_04750 [Candidatus Curtissbacteria bacterium RIFCSPHIGHO2_01_FULL_41_44]OGD97232.1 MAG: hypothetical protein A3E71_04190 [Candidatus Curtissbacteria bacterium RIFCSPHIGHO2_12_FULL_42_33]OGD99720.1 MAG: hypothetical protein A3B54_05610 [Candidatus Curtissbacteria bacterium RIFCSPLOWO2_01_FULL_42_50]OGE02359.1 MAG: hypothetical protein A3G16_03995 [Ca
MDPYREEILEHWQNPQNFGVMQGADVVIEQINPLCGDEVTFYFRIRDNRIKEVLFIGNGCAISIASASMLSEAIKNKPISILSKITGQDVLNLIGGPSASSGFPPARLKCAFLALEAVRKVTSNR